MKGHNFFFLFIIMTPFLLMASVPSPARSSLKAVVSQTLNIHFIVRPPYIFSNSKGELSGSVADPAIQVLNKAGLTYKFKETPVNRQFKLIKESQGLDCVIGMEQTASRSAFAKFSEPVYIGQPVYAIMNAKIKYQLGVTLKEMLEKYSILVKENYTLGDDITAMVMKSTKKLITSVDSDQMVQMIQKGHADFMMISNEEIEYYIENGVLNKKLIQIAELPEVKKRFTRRFMCSFAVGDHVIQSLNKAIKTLDVKPAEPTKISLIPRKSL